MNLRCQSFCQGRWPQTPCHQWPPGHRPCTPRGGHTPVMAWLVRLEHAQRRRAPAAHSTHPLALPSSRSALPKRNAELAIATTTVLHLLARHHRYTSPNPAHQQLGHHHLFHPDPLAPLAELG